MHDGLFGEVFEQVVIDVAAEVLLNILILFAGKLLFLLNSCVAIGFIDSVGLQVPQSDFLVVGARG